MSADINKCLLRAKSPQSNSYLLYFLFLFVVLCVFIALQDVFSQNPQVKHRYLSCLWIQLSLASVSVRFLLTTGRRFNGLMTLQNYSYITLQSYMSLELLPRGIITKFSNVIQTHKSMQHKSTHVRNDCHTQSILQKTNKVTGVKCQIKSKPEINDLRHQKVKHTFFLTWSFPKRKHSWFFNHRMLKNNAFPGKYSKLDNVHYIQRNITQK